MENKYIIVSLDDYMEVNDGKIDRHKEVVFTEYSTGHMQSNSPFGGGGYNIRTCIGHTVTHVKRLPTRHYSGVTKDGKTMIVANSCATINMPLSILKEVDFP